MDTATQSGSSSKMAEHTKRKTPTTAVKTTAKKIAKVKKGAPITRAPNGIKPTDTLTSSACHEYGQFDINPLPPVVNLSPPTAGIQELLVTKYADVRSAVEVPSNTKPHLKSTLSNTLQAQNPNSKLKNANLDPKRVIKTDFQSQSVTNVPTRSPLSPRSRCAAGGPNGPKVYDDLGFLLSYSKCTRPGLFRRRRPTGKGYFEMLEREAAESERKGVIMGTPRERQSALTSMAWNDRVARELGIIYHEVEMKHFEELAARGFVGKDGEFEAVNISEEERNRLSTLATGSSFRV